MGEYYKTNARKLTFTELKNLGRPWDAAAAWAGARLGLPVLQTSGGKHVQDFHEIELDAHRFPPEALAALQPTIEQFRNHGFLAERYFRLPTLRQDAVIAVVHLTHESGHITAVLYYTYNPLPKVPTSRIHFLVLSALLDGTLLVSSNDRPRLRLPQEIKVLRQVDGKPEELMNLHQQHMTAFPPESFVSVIPGSDDAAGMWHRYDRRIYEFRMACGVYIPIPPKEVEQMTLANEAAGASVQDGHPEHASALVELELLQNQKASWSSALVLLVVSALVYFASGSRAQSIGYLVILIPVLFLHESGHFLAMRLFRYRNLRMFFIPFFGAAVTGQNFNVSGWKKVVVSLMGPVPGILLGTILAILHFQDPSERLARVASVLLLLNGFNLLPILPLDGGWVVHALIFSRHAVLEVIFRGLAVIGLAYLALTSNSILLGFVAFNMAITLPTTYRLGQIASRLRRQGMSPFSADNQSIPRETAVTILDEIRRVFPKLTSPKTAAIHALNVFQSINARPPGWLATSGLLLGYLGSLLTAVVMGSLIIVFGHSGLWDDKNETQIAPLPRPLACESVDTDNLRLDAESYDVPTVTMFAHFKDRIGAADAARSIQSQGLSSNHIVVFGESLLLSVPQSAEQGYRKQLMALGMEEKSLEVSDTNHVIELSLSWPLPPGTVTNAVEEELRDYFENLYQATGGTPLLIPPWIVPDPRTSNQKADQTKARRSLRRARNVEITPETTARVKKLTTELKASAANPDKTEKKRLIEKQKELVAIDRQRQLEALQSDTTGSLDTTTVQLYARLESESVKTNATERAQWTAKLNARLGVLDSKEPPRDFANGMEIGTFVWVIRTESEVALHHLTFSNGMERVFPIVQWLCGNGITNLSYTLSVE